VTGDLEKLARKYCWWMTPETALARKEMFLCQLMQLGTWEDLAVARKLFGEQSLKQALRSAPPGILDPRSWNFWNLLLGNVPVPLMPVRPLP
jgi:hypothetical protein